MKVFGYVTAVAYLYLFFEGSESNINKSKELIIVGVLIPLVVILSSL